MKRRQYWHSRLVYRQKNVKWHNKYQKPKIPKSRMAIVHIMDMPSDMLWGISESEWYKRAVRKYTMLRNTAKEGK